MLRIRHLLAWATGIALLGVLAWDLSGLDLPLAHASGDAHGFPLKAEPLLNAVLHDGGRYAAWFTVLVLCVAVAAPFGPFNRLDFWRRLQLPVTALIATGVVLALKTFSATSCPWDLSEFGGIARYVSHWAGWRVPDGGVGRCFPAGHATSGFAFFGGYFAWRETSPALARAWLLAAVTSGLVFGVAQQLRGAHFMSHTLWTGWLCWVTAWLADPLFRQRASSGEASRWA